MNTLDRESIRQMIETLQSLESAGFSSQSSPISILLEALIDLSLQVGIAIHESRPGRRLNQGLLFDDKGPADELGNSRQVRIGNKTEPVLWDPQGKKFFHALAAFFVDLKKTQNILVSFHGTMSEFFSPEFHTRGVSTKKTTSKKTHSQKNMGYYRRQRRRRKAR
jgi:hypothetical protein